MRENKYDDEVFFTKYSSFPRSVRGLNAAGEWHAFQKLMPDFTGERVLDIGCGFGWHCAYAAERGAASVLGIDLSENMLRVAKEKWDFPHVSFLKMAMEDMDFPENSFDVAISSLAFHYTPDFAAVCRQVYRMLTPGGAFVFSVEHPVFTAQGMQDWTYDKNGKPLHWPVDHYFLEGRRDTIFLGESVIKYHRTLMTYVETLLQEGFAITGLVEPVPSEEVLRGNPGMADELRRPMMLLISAVKR